MSDFAFLELTESADGEVILRRSGDAADAEPLVSVRFSAEARLMLGARTTDIARAMVGAGVQLATHHLANPEGFEGDQKTLH
ncbi:hypothetical protein [Perlucidibaca aquatica]|jgi:hypothetical protein|uniref:hypothetical protein n=1 Tax=Perlucidibaca aquatica TaxID=1852776 RepID=UPI00083B8263|nr:hypothetical protein [Perlucidibaca aquatica]